MPSETMDLQRGSSLCLPSSSFFSEEIRFPERQVGFWKPESLPDFSGTEGTPLMSGKRSISPSMNSWRAVGRNFGVPSDLRVEPMPLFVEGNKVDLNGAHYENSLFSSSLSEVFEKTLRLSSTNVPLGQSVDTLNSNFGEVEPFESLEEIEAQTIGDLLPDDDDLLSGVINDIGFVARPNGGDDMDDIFFTSGGIELEAEDNFTGNRNFDYASGKASVEGLSSQYAGEHPFGEHPSRTLFVRNIHSNVEDAELNALFQQYGDIRTLYTACKHRGFIMVSYYDIRAARNAMKALQNKPLRRRKLDIHFSIPKDNPPEKDINQGTLVAFNLDSSISTDEICQIFGVYGEVKEVRETPHKHHHKFIEFYDVRAAETALVALNRSDIAGKKIKLELSRPGGARRCSTQQLSPEQELEEYSGCWNGSPPNNNSPSGFYGSIPFGVMSSSGVDHGVVHNMHSAAQAPANPFVETGFRGISPSVSQNLSSPIRVASVGNHSNQTGNCELSHSLGQMKFGFQCMPAFHPRSVPDYHDGLTHGISYNSSTARPSLGSNYPFERNEAAFGVSRNGSCPLHGQQSAWNTWSNSPAFVNNISAHPPPQMHAMNPILNAVHHHVGSAPSMNPPFWSSPGSVGSVGMHPHSIFPHSGGNCVDPAHMVVNSPQQRCHFHARVPPPFEAPNDRIRSRRNDPNANQADNKKLYELDVSRIIRGEDSRTTLMIKNIPNKYTSKMLLAAIDEQNRGTYDFIYLPIDFKNKCNVGYAFINMINPQHIIPFYQAFNGKKWEKFNSEKVATLAYARIQGKTALVAHFQNSSLMNEDKRCRPILFHSDGPNAGDQEPFPVGINIRSRPCRSRMCGRDEIHRESPSTSPNGDEIYNGLDSSNVGEERMIFNHGQRGN